MVAQEPSKARIEEARLLMAQVEELRTTRALSQAQVASACWMSQGHYSKLAAGRVLPGARSRDALREWLARPVGKMHDPSALDEAAEVAEALIRECRRLSALLKAGRPISRKAEPPESPDAR